MIRTIRSIAMGVILATATLGVITLGGTPVVEARALGDKKEAHPHIRAAILELKEARTELKEAAHDFGGHRKEAIEAVNVAIKQLELALKYDKK